MQCDEARDRLGALYDGELATAAAQEVGAHVRECAGCTAVLADYRRMSRQLQLAGREPVPEALVSRVRASLAASVASESNPVSVVEAGRKRSLRPSGKVGWLVGQAAALAAACLIAVLATWFTVAQRSELAATERDVLSAHMRAMLQDSPVQVASNDQHNVKPWFTGRLEFAPSVKDLDSDGYFLVGGRVDFIDGRRVGALVYKRRLHLVDVFTWPTSGAVDAAPVAMVRNGYNLLTWTRHGVVFWAVSDLNAAELSQLQSLL